MADYSTRGSSSAVGYGVDVCKDPSYTAVVWSWNLLDTELLYPVLVSQDLSGNLRPTQPVFLQGWGMQWGSGHRKGIENLYTGIHMYHVQTDVWVELGAQQPV